MAKVMVTGGAGFIGSHIVDLFLSSGHSVEVIDNLSSGVKSNLPKEVPLHVLDIREESVRQLLSRSEPDILIHAAAQMSVSESMKDPHFDAQVNVCGLINLLQSFSKETYPYVLFISTGGAIYGEQDYFPAREDHPIRPTSAYGLAKRVGEMYLDLWEREFGLEYGILRLANIYGPRQNPHGEAGVVAIMNRILLAHGTPTIFGTGEQTRDFTYVGDVAAAVQKMCEARRKGVFNIGTGIETSVNTLYAQICTAAGVQVTPNYAPARPGEQLRSCIDALLAQEVLNWTPEVSLLEGLKNTTQWFRKQQGGCCCGG